MCRWAAYSGNEIFLEDIIARPSHSLIAQSIDAAECPTSTNADGFGVAWYDNRPEPGLFRDAFPAWSDPNLQAIARQVKSRLFMSHVRSSTSVSISRDNCHPFASGKWSFMHNGRSGGFKTFRKKIEMSIKDELFSQRLGNTDSEALFLMALGYGLDRDPLQAMSCAVTQFEDISRHYGNTPHMRFSSAFTNGQTLFATRYSSDTICPTVYYKYCERFQGWCICSEPLNGCEGEWTELPVGSTLVIDRGQMEILPFMQYRYDRVLRLAS